MRRRQLLLCEYLIQRRSGGRLGEVPFLNLQSGMTLRIHPTAPNPRRRPQSQMIEIEGIGILLLPIVLQLLIQRFDQVMLKGLRPIHPINLIDFEAPLDKLATLFRNPTAINYRFGHYVLDELHFGVG
jgi:hypothetical protein